MTLEHADTIRMRRHRGRSWMEIAAEHTWDRIAADLGVHQTTLRAALSGKPVKCLSDDQLRDVRRRRRRYRHAVYRHRKDSDAALKAEYRMSTDTLHKIMDREAHTTSAINTFLTMRL